MTRSSGRTEGTPADGLNDGKAFQRKKIDGGDPHGKN